MFDGLVVFLQLIQRMGEFPNLPLILDLHLLRLALEHFVSVVYFLYLQQCLFVLKLRIVTPDGTSFLTHKSVIIQSSQNYQLSNKQRLASQTTPPRICTSRCRFFLDRWVNLSEWKSLELIESLFIMPLLLPILFNDAQQFLLSIVQKRYFSALTILDLFLDWY